MKVLYRFSENRYVDYSFASKVKLEEEVWIESKEEGDILHNNGDISIITPFEKKLISENDSIILFESEVRKYLIDGDEILIDPIYGDISICECKLSIQEKKIINPNKIPLYVNGLKTNKETIDYDNSFHILISNIDLFINNNVLTVYGDLEEFDTSLKESSLENEYLSEFPKYRRSPRLIKRASGDTIEILKPPEVEVIKKGEVLKLLIPPIISIIATIVMGVIMPRGPYVIIGLISTGVSFIFSIVNYFESKNERKLKNEARKKVYEAYLLKTRKKLNVLKIKEEEANQFHNLDAKKIEKEVNIFSNRIYEKDIDDDDFLSIYLGDRRERASYTIDLQTSELELTKDEYIEEANEIKNEFSHIEKSPVTINLRENHLGLVGDKEDLHIQIKQILSQVTFFQSYHDVEVIMLYKEEFKSEFDYTKWYPHLKVKAVNVTGNLYLDKVRDIVLNSLTQILKQRRDQVKEKKKEHAFTPHYIIIIDDYRLIMDHSIMEYLQEDTTNLGYSLIFNAKQTADLPENIKTVVEVEDKTKATLLIDNGKYMNKIFNLLNINDINFDKVARNLSILEHQKGITSQIPESITFFELYGVKTPEELNVLERWSNHESHKSLSVPLGVRAKDDIVELNLHEKAHGPHGLVAGTTGSGKSEIVQSYILSLAVNFSPTEVGFLLIDYKGGGMASLFNNLPHLLGTITNLDGSESMRALASIKSELRRRQEIFNENNVNNIIQYNKLFKNGKAKEPLPSLFIISDEFAELKKEQPEFMSELVSAARIGRSLGVKLILATQKPSGVVDDQIWSNSKFKLALKVQNESDSKEVIKTSDAASITQPGRAYLQVGNNEIYELFQSAWSGATYYQGDEEKASKSNMVYRINDLGQLDLVNKDLSEEIDSNEVLLTELDVTVSYIRENYKGKVEIRKPWLPPLERQYKSPHIELEDPNLDNIKSLDLLCPIGLIDIPEEQKQIDYVLDFISDGNLAVFSSNGYGKSFTLGTIMATLAVKNNPQLLNFYILDLGNSGLIAYSKMAHTADYMTYDSIEKISKFMKLINTSISERKKIFSTNSVQNFDTYNQLNKETPMKAIFVFIDGFDIVKELPMEFEDFITKVSRDGPGLGIYTVITATRLNAIRYAIINNFKSKIAHFLYDSSEISGIVGRSKYILPEIKGRALVKMNNINLMHVYSPVEFETSIELIEKTSHFINSINNAYSGEQIKGLPILPETFTSNDFMLYEEEVAVELKLGLCVNNVVVVDANIRNSPYLIIGPQKSGKTNLLKLLISQTIQESTNYIFDSKSLELFEYKGISEHINYITTEDDVLDFINDFYTEIEDRRDQLEDALKEGSVNPKEFFENFEKFNVFIDNIDDFIERVKGEEKRIVDLLKETSNLGINIIVTGGATQMKGYDDITKFVKTSINGVVLGDQGVNTVFPVPRSKEYPSFGFGLLFNNGTYRRVKLPKFIKREEENE